jgi:hypothetical protein
MRNKEGFVVGMSFLIAVCLACDGASRIGGRVVDHDGKPIENASVLFETIEKGEPAEAYQCETRTSTDGVFGCGLVHQPWETRLRLTITKAGYNKYVRELSSGEVAKSPGGNMGSQVITLDTP